MCKVPKDAKKLEAVIRMEMLGLFKPCIKSFDKYDEVQLSEPTGGLYEFNDDEELNAKVKEFEEQYDGLVYHVIHSYTEFGELYSFLYVSDYEEEWEMDKADIEDGYAVAYVWNKTDEWMSELGGIAVRELFGGLVRVG
jgi:hypothetical protein